MRMNEKNIIYPDLIIIDLPERITFQNIRLMEELLVEKLRVGTPVVLCNCKKLLFIDSTGIGMLVKIIKTVVGNHTKLRFFNMKAEIHAIFRIAKLDNFFNIISEKEVRLLLLQHADSIHHSTPQYNA